MVAPFVAGTRWWAVDQRAHITTVLREKVTVSDSPPTPQVPQKTSSVLNILRY